ncbi:MAG: NADPH-dependent FMN reductase [Dehalococcoidia bacterium]
MENELDIAVLVGSLRKGSYTRKVAHHLGSYPGILRMRHVEIGNLPLYDQDLDAGDSPPREWREFRQQIKAADGVLFATPEYNRSVPGVLKNAIDVGSRPYGDSAWDGKPAAIVSVSPGAIGAFGANHHLRQSLVFLNMPTMQQPEAYVGGAADLFDDDGNITRKSTDDFLRTFVEAFSRWVTLHQPRVAEAALALR